MKDSGVMGLVDILAAEKEKRNKEIKGYEFMRDAIDNRKRIRAEKENLPRGYDPSIGISVDEYFAVYPVDRYCTWPCQVCAFKNICGQI